MKKMALDALRSEIRSHMDERRYRHTLGVEKEMLYMADGLAPELRYEASLAALLHDITKCLSAEEQKAYCQLHGLVIDHDEVLAPALLHAKTGAHYAKANYPAYVTDAVVQAISSHTTAKPPLSLLSAMLFVADFTEEGRTYLDCLRLRELLHAKPLAGDAGRQHFKQVLLSAMELSIEELLREGRPIALQTVEARNSFLLGELLF